MNKREFISETVKIRNKLQETILTADLSKSVSNSYWEKKKTKINELYDLFNYAYIDYISSNKKIYEDARWKQIQLERNERPQLKRIPFSKETEDSELSSFFRESTEYITTVTDNSRKPFLLLMRLLQLRNKKEKKQVEAFLEEDEVQEIIREAEDYPDARKKLIEEGIKRSEDGRFISLIDKNGKELKWNIKKYAERLLRTETRVLQTQGVLDAAQEVDSDLVQVSSHNSNCSICVGYEGKIYSVSGNSPLFPPLDDTPPYHP